MTPPAPDRTDDRVSILIVDDLPEKLLVFGSVLEELDQHLVFVRSGREALREVLQREFAVILLDVNMPEIDGFETAALLRQYKRSADTPIIFITSYADEIQTERGYSMGAVDYIQSPVVPHVLRSKVRVFVRLFALQRQLRRQADAHAAAAASDAARRVAEANDRRSALLADASHTLNASLDLDVTKRALVDLLLQRIASVAVVLPIHDQVPSETIWVGGTTMPAARVAAAGLAPAVRQLLLEAARERREVALDDPVVVTRLTGSDFGLGAIADVDRRLHHVAALPLVNGDRLLGALLLGAADDAQHEDWIVLDDLVARAAAALENARLYGSLQVEIVERRAAESELQDQARRKDEFLAMLSHELRNPLAPIRTALEVIRRIAPAEPKFTWATDIMVRQLRQMTRLIDELLDVARISRGKIALTREKVDLKAVIAHSVETVQPGIDAREQTLVVDSFEEPVWLHGDFARLSQIVANLLHNASKYSEKGSTIELHSSRDAQGAAIRVRDHGMGIDPQLLPRVFDLFTQGERGLDRRQGGLGVGLTLARRLATLHGGSIEAHSEGVGRGAEFIVRLPCIGLVRAVEGVASRPDSSHAPRCRILIVDDNGDAALSVATLLEMAGHTLRTAKDGDEALEVASRFAPEVVVLDIGLPGLDGYEVARRLRRDAALADALLIALTGYGQKEDRRAAQQAGFDQHFVKPADPEALLACIEGWTAERSRGRTLQPRAHRDA